MIEYPIYIEVPEGYWTMTTTTDRDVLENPNKYWHGNDEE